MHTSLSFTSVSRHTYTHREPHVGTRLQVQEHLRGHHVVDPDGEAAVAPDQAAAQLREAVHAPRGGVGAVIPAMYIDECWCFTRSGEPVLMIALPTYDP